MNSPYSIENLWPKEQTVNLFSNENGSVSDYLRKLYGELEGEIDSFADEKIVNCDVDEWTEYLTEKYRVCLLYTSPSPRDTR